MSDLKSDSVPETKQSFTVAASPFNSVKLELGIVLVVGFFLLFVVSMTINSQIIQLGVLGGYGLVTMSWLIFRVKRLTVKLND